MQITRQPYNFILNQSKKKKKNYDLLICNDKFREL